MPAKSSLALYIGKGGQRTPMGLKLTSLMIFMHSISNPLPFSKIKEMACGHAKQAIEVQFLLWEVAHLRLPF